MIPDDRLEPVTDEYGGVWQFYKATIPGTEFQYSYTLQLPLEIHNYIVDHYVGTNEQVPLPDDFHFTPQMIKDIAQHWEAMLGENPLEAETDFRAAVEEMANHRYYRIWKNENLTIDEIEDLFEQRESVVNEPFDLDQELAYEVPAPLLDGKPIDIEQINSLIDQGQLSDPTPADNDFVDEDLLKPAPLNFGEYINHVADYMKERAAGFMQEMKDTFDTFGR